MAAGFVPARWSASRPAPSIAQIANVYRERQALTLGIIRIVQVKWRKDRHVMLSPEVLDLLRQCRKVRTTRYDAGVPVEERWLFPGRKADNR
jgi:hypothetical protein